MAPIGGDCRRDTFKSLAKCYEREIRFVDCTWLNADTKMSAFSKILEMKRVIIQYIRVTAKYISAVRNSN